MLADLAALEIGIAEPRGFPVTECELAVEHGLTVYDTAYLHVAIERQIPIATLDAKLARAAKKHKLLFA
jgi:predicted nucleic acid-binding protein